MISNIDGNKSWLTRARLLLRRLCEGWRLWPSLSSAHLGYSVPRFRSAGTSDMREEATSAAATQPQKRPNASTSRNNEEEERPRRDEDNEERGDEQAGSRDGYQCSWLPAGLLGPSLLVENRGSTGEFLPRQPTGLDLMTYTVSWTEQLGTTLPGNGIGSAGSSYPPHWRSSRRRCCSGSNSVSK